MLGGSVGFGSGAGCSGGTGSGQTASHPNILLLLVDQLRTPPPGYAEDEGMAWGMREIFGFQDISPNNSYKKYFPGILRLRKNAVVLKTHYTASSACSPSRACIFTGQYTTGVQQTDGMFKSAEDVPWLDPDGPPTLGDWFRAAGYTAHYFGKWHVSDPKAPDYLEPWGFSNWEASYPEPHGADPYNLGVYRDIGFVDNLTKFLTMQGSAESTPPWLAVGSLVDPHDCSSWPVSWQLPADKGVVPWTTYPPPPPIPAQGDVSLPNPDGLQVELNPEGFPQDTFTLPPTFNETLDAKPRCQYDYSLKWGLALKSKMAIYSPHPFQLQGEYAEAWSLAYNQFYMYCHYLAELQIRRILQSLDDNGLADNTIVVFLSDHGETAGAHGGMIQKWHSAYEEAIRVPMVISSPLVNNNPDQIRYIAQPTSSIDLAPTLLGLAGFNLDNINSVLNDSSISNYFMGANLSSHIKGEASGEIPGPDGGARPGVFFMTNDLITELGADPDSDTLEKYETFMSNVEIVKEQGYDLESGPVRQPNNVRALCTGDWKIVRYIDPNEVEADEWELYYLTIDPIEQTNLVDYRTGVIRGDVIVPGWTTTELQAKNQELKAALADQEAIALKKNT